MRLLGFMLGSLLLLAACAEGSSADAGSGASSPTGQGASASAAGGEAGNGASGAGEAGAPAATGGTGGTGGGWLEQSCPQGTFATGFGGDGALQCDTIDAAVAAAVNAACSIYAGWRDSCDGCGFVPSKWGRSDGISCQNGVGADNTCTTPNLGGLSPDTFGLNLDGDTDGNDKLYVGLTCVPPADAPVPGPCRAGTFVASYDGASVGCVTAHAAIASYVADHCRIYFGWRDSCDACTSAPAKWGRVGSVDCLNGAGADNTCTMPTLGAQSVELFGLNTDGDVNGDDKFYMGFHCQGAVASGGPAAQSCPDGELMTGVHADGTIECESPQSSAEAVVQSDCFVYYGWRDNCDGCTTAPAKWGRVNTNVCENGVGADNTCQTSPLDGTSIRLFGLNTDGDVGGDDKFYTALFCP